GVAVQPVNLVQHTAEPRAVVRRDAELPENLFDIERLCFGVRVRHVAHVQDEVGLDDLFKCRAKRGNQHGRQIGNEADGVGQDDPQALRQLDCTQSRIEGCEQHVGGEHARLAHAIEQGRFAGIGVAHERYDRIRNPLATVAVKFTRALYFLELGLDARNALLDHAAVRLDLSFARAAEKAKTAPLALEVRPGTYQSALLVGEMRQLYLEGAFTRACAPPENLQDQAGAIDHLCTPSFFEIALLHRREGAVHHDDSALIGFDQTGYLLNLALPDEGRGPYAAQGHDSG